MDMTGRIQRLQVKDKLSEREIARMTGLWPVIRLDSSSHLKR